MTYSEISMDDERTGRAGLPVDRPAAEAWVNSPVADHVLVSKNTALDAPVTITVTGAGDDVTSAPSSSSWRPTPRPSSCCATW